MLTSLTREVKSHWVLQLSVGCCLPTSAAVSHSRCSLNYMNLVTWLCSSLGTLCQGIVSKPVLGQGPWPAGMSGGWFRPFLAGLGGELPGGLGGGAGALTASLQGRLRVTGGAASAPARRTLGDWPRARGRKATATNTTPCPRGPDAQGGCPGGISLLNGRMRTIHRLANC